MFQKSALAIAVVAVGFGCMQAVLLWFPVQSVVLESMQQHRGMENSKRLLETRSQSFFKHPNQWCTWVLENAWIRKCTATRVFLSGIQLQLSYHQPLFATKDGFVSTRGKVKKLPLSALEYKVLPKYLGGTKDVKKALTLHAWVSKSTLAKRLQSICASDQEGWSLKFEGNIVVKLGMERLESRWALFTSAIRNPRFANKNNQMFDMRHPKGFSNKTIKGSCTEVTGDKTAKFG